MADENSIGNLLDSRHGDKHTLHEKYLNPYAVVSARRFGAALDYVRASGVYVTDRDGAEYLDFDGGTGVFNIGRNHPTARRMLGEMLVLDSPNMVPRDNSLPSGLLAEALAACTPGELNKVIFTSSGSESTEVALKFARKLTGRPRLLYLEGDYHGGTYGALSVTDLDLASEGFGPPLPGCLRIARGDLAGLKRELSKSDVAGLIVEPYQGIDVRPIDRSYLLGAQQLCRQHDTMFIVDEVFTGFGRTGTMFASEQAGLEPDVLVLSKSLSAGYVPVGAAVIRREPYERVFNNRGAFVHGSTFEHNDLAMVAGLATLKVIADEKLVARSAEMGALLLEKLRALQQRYDMIADVRGSGLLIGIEFRSPRALRMRASGYLLAKRGVLGFMVMMQLLESHRIFTTIVVKNNILRLTPPLIIGPAEVDRFINAFEDVIQKIYSFPDGIGRFIFAKMIRHMRERL